MRLRNLSDLFMKLDLKTGLKVVVRGHLSVHIQGILTMLRSSNIFCCSRIETACRSKRANTSSSEVSRSRDKTDFVEQTPNKSGPGSNHER